MVVVLGILSNNAQQVVGFSSEGMALDHMLHVDDRCLKGSEVIVALIVQSNRNENAFGKAGQILVYDSNVALDEAQVLQAPPVTRTRRFGSVYAQRQLGVGEPPTGLQHCQNTSL